MDHGSMSGDSGGIPNDSPALDLWLQLHAAFMLIGFGIMLPLGAVLGMARMKMHRPLQIAGVSVVAVGTVLPFFHSARHVPLGPHQVLGWAMLVLLAGQVFAGFALRGRFAEMASASAVKAVKRFHGFAGKLSFFLPYVQFQLGFIAMTGTCWSIPGYHLGQCLAHYAMGSAFIFYGAFLALRYFDLTRRLLPLPDDCYDSVAILLWGIFNTFTEHRWGERWSHGDMQHTAMGLLWWGGGMIAVFTAFKLRSSVPNVFPSLILGITGVAMALHFQHRAFSTALHAYFGVSLILSSVSRIVSLYWAQGTRGNKGNMGILTAFLLVQSGILFMGSNEEALAFLDDVIGVDPASYGMALSASSFVVTGWICLLIWTYVTYGPRQGDFADGDMQNAPGRGYAGLDAAAANILVDGDDDDGIPLDTSPVRAYDSDDTAGGRKGRDSLSFDLGART